MVYANATNTTNTANTTNATVPAPSTSPASANTSPDSRPILISYDPITGEPSGDLNFTYFFTQVLSPNDTYASFYDWNDTVYDASNGTWWAGSCRVVQYGRGTELAASRLVASAGVLLTGATTAWLLGWLLA